MYPSGRWHGFWHQAEYGRQEMAEFELHFADGSIRGRGVDIVGLFLFSGTYDAVGNVELTKQYLGRHQVHYTGQHDGEGVIAGQWHIPPLWAGTFAMRPVHAPLITDYPIQEI
jgi:hypothetical protein